MSDFETLCEELECAVSDECLAFLTSHVAELETAYVGEADGLTLGWLYYRFGIETEAMQATRMMCAAVSNKYNMYDAQLQNVVGAGLRSPGPDPANARESFDLIAGYKQYREELEAAEANWSTACLSGKLPFTEFYDALWSAFGGT